jgi:hypothetical protein
MSFWTPRQLVDKYKSRLKAEKLHFWPDHFLGQAHEGGQK